MSSHKAFNTAKWVLDSAVSTKLRTTSHKLPEHVDFATSRNEFYEEPTALPTVYNSSIKLDLHRRDFTINTLAIQLSPAEATWRVLDFYGGLHDLDNRWIRVLHSLSFVDDPTRMLRAVRFEQRLGFSIEPRTIELIGIALPMLRRITGRRLYNELTLLLSEAAPENGLLQLQARGILEAIHPAFEITDQAAELFTRARATAAPWDSQSDTTDVYWHILACTLDTNALKNLCERLMIGGTQAESMLAAARLYHEVGSLTQRDLLPSTITGYLEKVPELALQAVWLVTDSRVLRERIQRYMLEWRHIKSAADGHTLRELGLPPGPEYRTILERLRAARLDGEVTTDEEEHRLLQRLIE